MYNSDSFKRLYNHYVITLHHFDVNQKVSVMISKSIFAAMYMCQAIDLCTKSGCGRVCGFWSRNYLSQSWQLHVCYYMGLLQHKVRFSSIQFDFLEV